MSNPPEKSLAAIVALLLLLSACASIQTAQRDRVLAAIRALRKIEAATQVGVTHQQYGILVIEAKADINEASEKLAEGELKKELTLAIDAYADAGEVWDKASVEGVLAQRLVKNYGTGAVNPVDAVTIPLVLLNAPEIRDRLWSIARQHTKRAATILEEAKY